MITAAHCTNVFKSNKTAEKLCVKETAAGKSYRERDNHVEIGL
jgi:hypothetical protein